MKAQAATVQTVIPLQTVRTAPAPLHPLRTALPVPPPHQRTASPSLNQSLSLTQKLPVAVIQAPVAAVKKTVAQMKSHLRRKESFR